MSPNLTLSVRDQGAAALDAGAPFCCWGRLSGPFLRTVADQPKAWRSPTVRWFGSSPELLTNWDHTAGGCDEPA